jgi:AcrR family transcriptional regulator
MSQRDDLLAAAKKLLVEKGYHRTTARDIVAESGAHLASIGYHYGSKDALMTAATIEAQGEWGDAIDAALRLASEASPSERLQIGVGELIPAMTRQREVLKASVQAYAQAGFDDEIRQVLADGARGARTDLAAGVLGLDPEEVDADTAEGLGSVIHALIAGLSLQALIEPESLPSGEQVGRALRTLTGQ